MTTTPTARTHGLLARVEANLLSVRREEFARLDLARAWALEHEVTDPELLRDPRRRPIPLGAVGLPVEEYAGAEFAAALELHPLAGRRWMADAVDIHDRLPNAWTATREGRLEVWVARRIAAATSHLSDEKAQWVDAVVADVLGTLPPSRLLALVEARVVQADRALADRKAEEAEGARAVWLSRRNELGIRALMVRGSGDGVRRLYGTIDHLAHLLRQHGDAELRAQSMDVLRAEAAVLLASPLAVLKLMFGAGQFDGAEEVAEAIRAARPSSIRPRAVVYLHLTPATLYGAGVARAVELGALTRQQLVDVLGHHQVSLRPVIDLDAGMAADCYEIPAAVDERLQLAKPADVFPFASSLSRTLDRDHTEPYDAHGPPGQTAEDKLGKLLRHHHRIKTHGGWRVRQRDRRFTWTSPHGRTYVTDSNGTRRVRRPRTRVPDIFGAAAA
jgi:hypothetical protein